MRGPSSQGQLADFGSRLRRRENASSSNPSLSARTIERSFVAGATQDFGSRLRRHEITSSSNPSLSARTTERSFVAGHFQIRLAAQTPRKRPQVRIPASARTIERSFVAAATQDLARGSDAAKTPRNHISPSPKLSCASRFDVGWRSTDGTPKPSFKIDTWFHTAHQESVRRGD